MVRRIETLLCKSPSPTNSSILTVPWESTLKELYEKQRMPISADKNTTVSGGESSRSTDIVRDSLEKETLEHGEVPMELDPKDNQIPLSGLRLPTPSPQTLPNTLSLSNNEDEQKNALRLMDLLAGCSSSQEDMHSVSKESPKNATSSKRILPMSSQEEEDDDKEDEDTVKRRRISSPKESLEIHAVQQPQESESAPTEIRLLEELVEEMESKTRKGVTTVSSSLDRDSFSLPLHRNPLTDLSPRRQDGLLLSSSAPTHFPGSLSPWSFSNPYPLIGQSQILEPIPADSQKDSSDENREPLTL
jgi:hypothetical protein